MTPILALPTPPDPAPDRPEAFAAAPAGPTYPGAPETVLNQWQKRRRRMAFGPGEGLPAPDVDLRPLLAATIPPPDPLPPGGVSLHAEKLHGIRTDLVGRPELAALNAILIAHLRKSRPPRDAAPLFRRIWTEHGAELMPHLPGRWLISSVITFGDHGETEAQRRIGLGMNVFFSLMKLYEFERLYSGHAPDQPFRRRRLRGKSMPLGMPNFALIGGGLDVNLLAQLWHEARSEPVAGALACHLLDRLNTDPGNLFRRIGLMRIAKRAALAAKPPRPQEGSPPPDEDGQT
jgi:hypothetical protein